MTLADAVDADGRVLNLPQLRAKVLGGQVFAEENVSPSRLAAREMIQKKQAKFAAKHAAIMAIGAPKPGASLADTLREVESQISGNRSEIGFAYAEDGTLLIARQGKKNAIEFSSEDGGVLQRSAVFTHNHPNGSPLSLDDFVAANTFSMRRVRAVGLEPETGRRVTYELVRHEASKVASNTNLDATFMRELKAVYSGDRPEMIKELNRRLPQAQQTKQSIQRVWNDLIHERLEKLAAKDTRFTYTRKHERRNDR
ncbi:MAG: hypothetical protein H0X04_00530 [Chthoniobacterales bacterium]|nr:hypothetical protein [Chthoniobacterales bacterium]